MSVTEPETRQGRWTAKRLLGLILWLQVGIAVILLTIDIGPSLPGLLSPSRAPAFELPVAPGDQVRRFRTDDPGGAPLPFDIPSDMPSRLTMDARQIAGRPALLLTGAILEGDAERFAETLKLRPNVELVALHSHGGSVGDALAIGRLIRATGLDTVMTPRTVCLSACPYMLIGGVARIVADDAQVGVHQHYFGENTVLPAFLAVESIQRGQGEVMAFLIDMGVDPALMRPGLLTPPDEIYVFVREELEKYRILAE